MCWATLDCLLQLDSLGYITVPREEFARERNDIRAAILQRAWSSALQSFTGAFDEEFLDATLLLLPAVVFFLAMTRECALHGTAYRSGLEEGL
jgi:hypothetical protein